jgi:hypothetical protein
MACTFDAFMPGTDNDPDPSRTFDEYLAQFRANANAAGNVLMGSAFRFEGPAVAKVEGDVFELMEAGAIWNAFAAWNQWMDGNGWTSTAFTQPAGAVITPSRKAAVLKLPRGYDATQLFKPEVRAAIQAHEHALKLHGMELGLSAPDIVGIRIPEPHSAAFAPFMQPLSNLGDTAREALEGSHVALEGTLEGRSLLFAIAVKRTTRSDRLYQPLFEANVLKYLIGEVLRGAAFRFHVHMGSLEGADVARRYSAASLPSLMRGGQFQKAVDRTLLAERPQAVAQVMLDELPMYAL